MGLLDKLFGRKKPDPSPPESTPTPASAMPEPPEGGQQAGDPPGQPDHDQ